MITTVGILVVLALILIVGYAVTIYNGLIEISRNVDKAWANIDVLLKQRHDELPKLISVCQGYRDFERGTLQALILARSHSMSAQAEGDRVRAAGEISGAVRGVLAMAEAYPVLKSGQNFLELQKRISGLEETIADRREFYNESVTILNTRMRQIPDVFFSGMLGLVPRTLYQVSEVDRTDVQITL